MVSSIPTPVRQAAISALPDIPRVEESLAARYHSLLALPDNRLERALTSFIQAEHELPEPARYDATLARLQAWLQLDAEERLIVARAFERALASMPREYVHRCREAERAVMMNALTFQQFRTLAESLPWLRDAELVEFADASPLVAA